LVGTLPRGGTLVHVTDNITPRMTRVIFSKKIQKKN